MFSSLPISMWYSTNTPPSITNAPNDVQLLANSTGGTAIFGTNDVEVVTNTGRMLGAFRWPAALTNMTGTWGITRPV